MKIPENIPSGKYEIPFGLISNEMKVPAINLAIEGGGAGGWYRIRELQIKD